jgi:hypothetical protein
MLFAADYPDYLNTLFSWRQPCWILPTLGWVRAYQPKGPLTEPCSCQGLFPLPQSPLLQGSLAESCSPPLCRGLAFSAQRSLTWPCTCQSTFSVCLVTGLSQGTMVKIGRGTRQAKMSAVHRFLSIPMGAYLDLLGLRRICKWTALFYLKASVFLPKMKIIIKIFSSSMQRNIILG